MDEQIRYKEYEDHKVKKVQKIKNGYGFRIELFFDDGTKKVQQRAGFKNKREADDARSVAIAQLKEHTYLTYGNILAKDYLEHWIEGYIRKIRNNYNTYYSYKSKTQKYIIPLLGNKRMGELNSGDVMRLYNRVYEISKSSARVVKAIVHSCFDDAVIEKAMRVNVSEAINLPKNEKQLPYHTRAIAVEKTLNEEQVITLINGSKNTKIYLMILFNAILGLRCSEIIGLKYEDVDFAKRTIRIQRQLGRDLSISKEDAKPKTYTKQEIGLKTSSSYRTIDLPDIVFEAILQELARYEKNRSRRKTSFQDLGYIVCSSYGRPRSKNFHFKEFKRLLKELDLPNIRWHDLRATAATIILREFKNPILASHVLGHKHEILTIDKYGDDYRIAQIDMTTLNSFIDDIAPSNEEIVDATSISIDVDRYLVANI